MTSPRKQLQLLVIARDAVTREGLRVLLEATGEVVVATSGELQAARPDAVIVSLGAADGTDGDDISRDGRAAEEPPTVFLGPLARLREVGAGSHGALGFVANGADGQRILTAVRAVMAGFSVFDEGIETHDGAARSGDSALTPREREVLLLVARGLATKEIARELAMSEHTAKFHVGQILQKLGAASRAEAVMIAARMGLIPI